MFGDSNASSSIRIFNYPLAGSLRCVTPGAKRVGSEHFVCHSNTPAGPGTTEIKRTSVDQVTATTWGPGHEWLVEQVPKLAGLHDEVGDFTPPATLDRLWRRYPFALGQTNQPWEALIHGVFGQKVQVTKANQSERLLASTFGTKAPGPHDGWVMPTAEQVANMGYHHFHRLGVERKRAEALIRAARELIRVSNIADVGAEEFKARFERLRGIGPWTTNIASVIAYGDADAVPVGDFHIPNTVCWALKGEPRGNDERMLELLQPYRGHRYRVIRLAKSSGSAPKYGPRLSLEGDGMHRGR